MTTAQDQPPGWSAPARRSPITLGRGSLIVLALVIIAIVASTTYRSDSAPRAGEQAKFDPAKYGAQTYEPKVVPAIQKKAVDIATLQKAIADDPDTAGQKYGSRDGTGPYSYAVKLTGTAAELKSGLLEVKVPGLNDTRVSVQVGPAINGTALRDAVGFIKFGQFVNQVDYADAGTALNNQVKTDVLASLDTGSLDGKKVTVVGAMTPLTADVLTVTPISVQVAP